MAEGKRLTVADLELSDVLTAPQASTLKDAREGLERNMIQQSLRKHGGKITPVAAELGISRPTLYELMDKLGIVREAKEAS
jgi:two-component system NtrC family response regulator